VSLLLLAQWAHHQHHGLWPILATQWDADWYLGIAQHGYTHHLGTRYDANNLAFFPMYPFLVKAAAVLTPGTRATTPPSWPRGESSPSATISTAGAWPCC
jgi:hypothetical protein